GSDDRSGSATIRIPVMTGLVRFVKLSVVAGAPGVLKGSVPLSLSSLVLSSVGSVIAVLAEELESEDRAATEARDTEVRSNAGRVAEDTAPDDTATAAKAKALSSRFGVGSVLAR